MSQSTLQIFYYYTSNKNGMSSLAFLMIFCSCFGQFLCDYDSDCLLREKETLDGLVVTWAPPGSNNPWAFNALPRTTKEAKSQGWTKVDDGCADSSAQHKGKRYILDNDRSVLIIYDTNGYVAGLQRTIPKALADTGGVIDFTKMPFADQENIKGEERYVFTNYFIDPENVCVGRSAAEFKLQGTKNQVYIKNGPESYLQPPNAEDRKTLDNQKWTKGLCVPAMGNHDYLGASEYMSCANQQPYFLTYDCGRLVSVGFFVIGNFTQEPRYEYVPKDTLGIFIDPVPKCLNDVYKPETNGISSMHMFFTSEPKKIPCPT